MENAWINTAAFTKNNCNSDTSIEVTLFLSSKKHTTLLPLPTAFTLAALIWFTNLSAQQVYVFAGPSMNRLYHTKLNSKSYLTDFTNGMGYFAGYGLSVKTEDSITLFASVRIDHAAGGFNYVEELPEGRHNISGQFTKTALGITSGFEPFRIMKRIETCAEMQWGFRLHTNVTGYDVLHNDTTILSQTTLTKQDTRKFMTFGLAFSMAYSIYKKKETEALVFYRLYTGLTNELKQTGCSMKLASGGLGVMMRFK